MREAMRLAVVLLAVSWLALAGCGESVAEATEDESALIEDALGSADGSLQEVPDLGEEATSPDGGAAAALSSGGDHHPGAIDEGEVGADTTALASADGSAGTPEWARLDDHVVQPGPGMPGFQGPPAPSPVSLEPPPASPEPPAASLLPEALPAPPEPTPAPPEPTPAPSEPRPAPPSPSAPAEEPGFFSRVGQTVAGTYEQAVSNTTDFFEENLGLPGSGTLPGQTGDGRFPTMPQPTRPLPDSLAAQVRRAAPTFMASSDPVLAVAREAAARGLFHDISSEGKRRLMEFVTTQFGDTDDQVRFLVEGAALNKAAVGNDIWTTLYGLRSAPGYGGHKSVQAAEHFAYAYTNIEDGTSNQATMIGGVGVHAAKDLTVDNLRPVWRTITNTWDDVFGDGTQQKPVNWDSPSGAEVKWGYLGARIGALHREGKYAEARELFEGVL